MKRKLTCRNKAQLSKRFKTRKQFVSPVKHCEQTTFASISASKAKGQQCYITRMRRQERMNPRQLKKCRKKQRKSGLTGSRYSGMCQSRLKPAGFKNHDGTDLNSHN